MDAKNLILAVALTILLPMKMYGQWTDCDSLSVSDKNVRNYDFEWRQTILPASLIGVGAVALARVSSGTAAATLPAARSAYGAMAGGSNSTIISSICLSPAP